MILLRHRVQQNKVPCSRCVLFIRYPHDYYSLRKRRNPCKHVIQTFFGFLIRVIISSLFENLILLLYCEPRLIASPVAMVGFNHSNKCIDKTASALGSTFIVDISSFRINVTRSNFQRNRARKLFVILAAVNICTISTVVTKETAGN